MNYELKRFFKVIKPFKFIGYDQTNKKDIDYGSFDVEDVIVLFCGIRQVDGGFSYSYYYYTVDGDRVIVHMDNLFQDVLKENTKEIEPSNEVKDILTEYVLEHFNNREKI